MFLQTQGVRAGQESAKKAIGFIEVIFFIHFISGIDNYEFQLIKVVGLDYNWKFGDKLQAIALIGKEEGIKGYWKGNLPQVF